MIDRYILHAEKETLSTRFNIQEDYHYHITFNATPTDALPIISSQHSKTCISTYWGQTPEWSNNKKLSQKLFNAKTEDIGIKSSLRRAVNERRCLIPATGFIHWNQIGKKTNVPYLYYLSSFELFAIAGVWETYSSLTDSMTNDNEYQIFKMLTIYNEKMRMVTPLVLKRDAESTWLSQGSVDNFEQLLTELDFSAYSVSPVISKSQEDNKMLIEHVPPIDQSGNYTLFG